jgi:gluconolactonase
MRKILICMGSFIIAATLMVRAQLLENSSIIAQGAKVEKLADGFAFTEGPAVDKKGNVYFTDQHSDKIWIWSTSGKLSLFSEGMGRANGLYFDGKGALLSCSDRENQLWKINVKKKSHSVLISSLQGKMLNGPNDLWVHPNGGIYFTDPLYARNYWNHRTPEMQQNGQYLYLLSPNGDVSCVDTAFKQPNGIIGSPDGTKLYVADIGDRKTYVYSILPNGSLANRKLFASMGSDGMTMDEKGNIYLTGRGVTVFNPQGEQIEQIPVDARWTANVCFGGKDMKTLFITASEYLYALKMNVKGIR